MVPHPNAPSPFHGKHPVLFAILNSYKKLTSQSSMRQPQLSPNKTTSFCRGRPSVFSNPKLRSAALCPSGQEPHSNNPPTFARYVNLSIICGFPVLNPFSLNIQSFLISLVALAYRLSILPSFLNAVSFFSAYLLSRLSGSRRWFDLAPLIFRFFNPSYR